MAQRPSKRHRTGIFALKGTSNSVSNDISSNKPSTPTAVTADMIEVQPDDALQFLIQPKVLNNFTCSGSLHFPLYVTGLGARAYTTRCISAS